MTKELALKIKDTGADMCGENGEYHTLVVDGPIFKNRINYENHQKIISGNYGYLDIK